MCLKGMFGIDMGHHIACDLVACEDVDGMQGILNECGERVVRLFKML